MPSEFASSSACGKLSLQSYVAYALNAQKVTSIRVRLRADNTPLSAACLQLKRCEEAVVL
jgi:hypothetical protein